MLSQIGIAVTRFQSLKVKVEYDVVEGGRGMVWRGFKYLTYNCWASVGTLHGLL